MSCYLVARINVIHDRETYGKYESGFMEVFEQHKGTMLGVDEEVRVIEGQWPVTRTVIVEFPSEEDAMAWYESDGYQKLLQHRLISSSADIALVHGIMPFDEN